MSDFVPPAAQEFEWDDLIDWSYWADNLDTAIPEPLGSFHAGPTGVSGCGGAVRGINTRHTEDNGLQQFGFEVSPTEQTQEVPVNPTTSYSQTSILASVLCSSSSILPVAESNVPTLSRRRTPRKTLKCPVLGCEDLNFARRYELSRHYRTKHGRSKSKQFVCYAQGCFNKQLLWAFTRPDKLTSHIKDSHHRETTFTRCDVRDCSYGPAILEVLGVHILRAHGFDSHVSNASPCKVYRCPIWRCKKRHMSVEKFPSHVEREHSFDEVRSVFGSLNADGFDVNQPSGTTDFSISVRCPVCNAGCGTMKEFAEHIWSAHLLLPSTGSDIGAEHFLRWRSELAGNTYFHYRSGVNKTTPWHRFKTHELSFPSTKKTIKCPACPFSVSNAAGRYIDFVEMVSNHHLSLLRPEKEVVDELRPYRFQILRLYPEFVTHPVFADLDPPRQQSMVWQGSV